MFENISKVNKSVKKFMEIWNEKGSSGDVYSFFTECSRVSMPSASLPNQSSITKWLEYLLCSSRNIELLAEHSRGVIENGDNDSRMRELTSEEGASLRKYAQLTKILMRLKWGLTVSYKTFTSCFAFSVFSKPFFLGFFIIKRCCTISLSSPLTRP